MKKLWFVYLGFFAILALTIVTYWLGMGGEQNELLRNVAYLVAPLFAVLGGLYTLKVYGLRDSTGCFYLYIVLGILFWFIGEVLWVYYEFILRVTPYPSMADYFYIGAYPAFLTGLLGQVRSSGVNWKKFDPVIVFLFGIIAALLAGLVVYFGVVLAYDPAATALENTVAIAYGLGDCIIILCSLLVLILAWEFKGGNLMRLYMICFFVFCMTMIADIGFAIYNTEYVAGAWWIKNTLDTLWIMQYLYFGLAFFTFGLSLKEAQNRLLKIAKKSA